MPWHESRHVNKERKTASRCIITFKGMHVSFEICCVWLIDRFKWMLSSEQLGIHANLLGAAGDISKEECKRKALKIIRQNLMNRVHEVDLELQDILPKEKAH